MGAGRGEFFTFLILKFKFESISSRFDGQITINLKKTSQVVIRKVQQENEWILGMKVESR